MKGILQPVPLSFYFLGCISFLHVGSWLQECCVQNHRCFPRDSAAPGTGPEVKRTPRPRPQAGTKPPSSPPTPPRGVPIKTQAGLVDELISFPVSESAAYVFSCGTDARHVSQSSSGRRRPGAGHFHLLASVCQRWQAAVLDGNVPRPRLSGGLSASSPGDVRRMRHL